ncbi:hypothetical protein [Hydrogenophaga sp. 5NK40-0174]|uniref:hypothetical protein n=1 Tax=Hydrogenophaga sp. 5NK40-0174 TaxID=3127649 RepID=UPI0033409859
MKQAGELGGQRFRLQGQEEHSDEAGNVQCDWFACYDDGRMALLSTSADGSARWFTPLGSKAALPPFDQWIEGATARLNGVSYRVVAKQMRRQTSARGAVTRPLKSEDTFGLVTLMSAGRGWLWVDYSRKDPRIWLGREVSLERLGLLENQGMLSAGSVASGLVAAGVASAVGGLASEGLSAESAPWPSKLVDDTGSPPMPRLLLDAFGYFEKADRRVTKVDRISLQNGQGAFGWTQYQLTDFRGRTAMLVDRGDDWHFLKELREAFPLSTDGASLMVDVREYGLTGKYRATIACLGNDTEEEAQVLPSAAETELRVFRQVAAESGEEAIVWWAGGGGSADRMWIGKEVAQDDVSAAFAVIDFDNPATRHQGEECAGVPLVLPDIGYDSALVNNARPLDWQDLRRRVGMGVIGVLFLAWGIRLWTMNAQSPIAITLLVCAALALVGSIFGNRLQELVRSGAESLLSSMRRE